MSNDNVCIFTDGNGMFHTARQLGIQIDYTKMLDIVTEGGEFTKAVFYTGTDENAEKQRSFLHWMTRNGWRVFRKPVRVDKQSGERKVDLVNEMITDIMLSVLNGAKTIVLISGNEDFAYTLGKLQDRDIRIVVAGYRSSMSNKLMDLADYYVEFDDKDIAKETEVEE